MSNMIYIHIIHGIYIYIYHDGISSTYNPKTMVTQGYCINSPIDRRADTTDVAHWNSQEPTAASWGKFSFPFRGTWWTINRLYPEL